MKNKPLISVVVPVYNVELYLDRCVKSVLSQSFNDFELILVDDGSTDKSGFICDEWEKKDGRIIVLHKKNGGLSDARNFGVKESRAPFVTFIDSDDFVSNDYLSYLYDLVISNNADVSMCKFVSTSDNDFCKPINQDSEDTIKVSDAKECCIRFCRDVQYCVAVCKLYRTNLVSAYSFPKGRVHEDAATVGKILYGAKYIAVGSRVLYGYYQNPKSIMHSPSAKRLEDQLWAVTENALFFTEKKESDIAKAAWDQVAYVLINDGVQRHILNNKILRMYYNIYRRNVQNKFKRLEVFLAINIYFLYRVYRKSRAIMCRVKSLFPSMF